MPDEIFERVLISIPANVLHGLHSLAHDEAQQSGERINVSRTIRHLIMAELKRRKKSRKNSSEMP